MVQASTMGRSSSTSRMRSAAARSGNRALPSLDKHCRRKIHAEGSAAPHLTVHCNSTVMTSDEIATNRQSESGALACRLGGEEWLEDALAICLRDPRARIREGHVHFFA